RAPRTLSPMAAPTPSWCNTAGGRSTLASLKRRSNSLGRAHPKTTKPKTASLAMTLLYQERGDGAGATHAMEHHDPHGHRNQRQEHERPRASGDEQDVIKRTVNGRGYAKRNQHQHASGELPTRKLGAADVITGERAAQTVTRHREQRA